MVAKHSNQKYIYFLLIKTWLSIASHFLDSFFQCLCIARMIAPKLAPTIRQFVRQWAMIKQEQPGRPVPYIFVQL